MGWSDQYTLATTGCVFSEVLSDKRIGMDPTNRDDGSSETRAAHIPAGDADRIWRRRTELWRMRGAFSQESTPGRPRDVLRTNDQSSGNVN